MKSQTFRMKNESYLRNVRKLICHCPICGRDYEANTDYCGRAEKPPINCPACKSAGLTSSDIGSRYEMHYALR